jgi:hypothetical protein
MIYVKLQECYYNMVFFVVCFRGMLVALWEARVGGVLVEAAGEDALDARGLEDTN